MRLARFARGRLLRHALPIFFTDFEGKKNDSLVGSRFSLVIQSSQEKLKIGGGGVGKGGGGNKVYFGQCESCESAVKRKAAIKHLSKCSYKIFIDGKLSRDNPR